MKCCLPDPAHVFNVHVSKGDQNTLMGWRSVAPIFRKMKYYTVKEENNILHKIKRRKGNWIGQILGTNGFVKHVIKGQTLKVTGKGGRIRKRLLHDLKETRRY